MEQEKDIVERLRRIEFDGEAWWYEWPEKALKEAADEIERLRREVMRLTKQELGQERGSESLTPKQLHDIAHDCEMD